MKGKNKKDLVGLFRSSKAKKTYEVFFFCTMLSGVSGQIRRALMRNPSRRTVLKSAGAAFVVPALSSRARPVDAQSARRRARDEAADTPKIALEAGASLTTTPSSESAAAHDWLNALTYSATACS